MRQARQMAGRRFWVHLVGALSLLLLLIGPLAVVGTSPTALAAPVSGADAALGTGLHLNSPGVPRTLRAAVQQTLGASSTASPDYIQNAELTAGDGLVGSQFGYSVTLSSDGNTALVGEPQALTQNLGVAHVFTKSGDSWTLTATLADDNFGQGMGFGAAVALSADGTTALVGALGDQFRGSLADVFTESGGSWSLVTELIGPGGFGQSAALSADGTRALIGSGNNTAYVEAESGGTWSQVAALTPSDGGLGFGHVVTLSSDGSTALVGAYQANGGAGAAYVFTNSSNAWSQMAELSVAGSGAFGVSVALSSDGTTDGTTALIGAMTTNSGTGSAYVFHQSRGRWSQTAMLTASDGQQNDNFGSAVALSSDGNIALVGAWQRTSSTGAAYLFSQSGGSWTQGSDLTANDGQAGDEFGRTVALSSDGTTALVGAGGFASGTNPGAAYVYVPLPKNELLASNEKPNDLFGDGIAMSADGTTAIIGAYNDGAGAAYVFAQSGGTWSQTATLTASGSSGFGSAVALSADGTTALVGAETTNSFRGSAYVFTQSGGTWTQTAMLTDASQISLNFGAAVALSSDGTTALVGAPLPTRPTVLPSCSRRAGVPGPRPPYSSPAITIVLGSALR